MPISHKTLNPVNHRVRRAVQGVAIFEAFKGLIALAALVGLLELIHHDLHRTASQWMQHLGLVPTARYTSWLIQAIDWISTTPAQTILFTGSSYIGLRWLEAWALWKDKSWGEWLGILSSSLYIPFEVHHIWASLSWFGIAILLTNMLVILLLIARLRQRNKSSA